MKQIEENNNDLNILVTGDFCPLSTFESIEDVESKRQILYEKLLNDLIKSDFSITNLECPLTESNNPIKKIGPNIKASKSDVKLIQNVFDVITLANNHILDYNEEGLNDTMRILKQHGIETVGAGASKELASHQLIVEKKALR